MGELTLYILLGPFSDYYYLCFNEVKRWEKRNDTKKTQQTTKIKQKKNYKTNPKDLPLISEKDTELGLTSSGTGHQN